MLIPKRKSLITSNGEEYMSIMTTIHEFGHVFGIGDHYGIGCPSTEAMNGSDGGPYDRACIYGEDGDLNAENGVYHLCQGCKNDMEDYIREFLAELEGI